MSYNIRFDTPKDGLNVWDNRKPYLAQNIRLQNALVIGLQEVCHNQLEYLQSELQQKYSWIGVGRDDGKQAGEYSPIFYDHTQLKVLDSGTFWLSETPWTPSSSWKSACLRICTWGKFSIQNQGDDSHFYIFNTHLDHRSTEARIRGLELINALLHGWTGSDPAILMGDFNATPLEEPIVSLTDPRKMFPTSLADTRKQAKNPVLGPSTTFPDWSGKMDMIIDYIMTKSDMLVDSFAVVDQKGPNGRPISDHNLLIADVFV